MVIYADTLPVPFIKTVYPLVDADLVMPPQPVQLADISQLPQGAVRLGGVPAQGATEPDLGHDLLRHFPDADFLPGADIDMAVADLGYAVGILHRRVVGIPEVHIQKHMHRIGRPVPHSVTASGVMP